MALPRPSPVTRALGAALAGVLVLSGVVGVPGCGGEHDAVSTSSGTVHVRTELGRAPHCADNEPCIDEYQRFVELAAPHARPIDQATLDGSLLAIARGEVPVLESTLPPSDVRAAVIDGLGIAFLLDDLATSALDVIVTAEHASEYYRETDLVLVDPWVGEVPAILLRPLGPGPYPAVVAVHGHGDDAAIYRDSYHGSEYPGHGYAILMLTMRAMGIDADEHAISRELLREGFSLIGLRVYESLLGLEYLRSRDDVRADRVGLIGHSGGSSTGNLTVRVMPANADEGFQAYVSDHHVSYFSSSPVEPYHCETVPALYPYHPAIDDLARAPVPALTVPYAYPFGVAGIFRFFDEQLKR